MKMYHSVIFTLGLIGCLGIFSSSSSNSCLTTGRAGRTTGLDSCLTTGIGLETGRGGLAAGISNIGLSLIWSRVIGTGFSGLNGVGEGLENSSSSACLIAEFIAGILNLFTYKALMVCYIGR